MTFRGPWDPARGYIATDAVTYGGSTYLALTANSSAEPDLSPQVWTVLAQVGGAGPTGPTGSAATVTIGMVTTSAAGTQAAVTNSGSSTAAVLNFTIPQGAAGAPGSGGGGAGGGTSGIPFVSVYHPVSFVDIYYSVNNSNASTSEIGTATQPVAALTWVPAACTATALNVFSQQTNAVTVTLRVGPTPSTLADTPLSCTAAPNGAAGTTCPASGSVAIAAGSFADLSITGASGTPAGVWTALACN